MAEARVEGGVPRTGGWFVINARDTRWVYDGVRSFCRFGGEGEAHFDDLGVGLYWLRPGRAMALYHHEAGQEDFMVLRGRCLLVVEGQERALSTWDLFHCPPRTPHTIIGAGEEPALVLAVGARKEKGSARYPIEEAGVRHDAGVRSAGESPDEAYARFGVPRAGPPPDVFRGGGRPRTPFVQDLDAASPVRSMPMRKATATMLPQPLIAVRDVERASRWYQRVLGATSGHGGVEYERLLVGDRLILQLHAREVEHHHGAFADPRAPVGNGVALWFATDRFDEAVRRIAGGDVVVVTDVHVNPNAGHREIWLRDEDGYLVVLADDPL